MTMDIDAAEESAWRIIAEKHNQNEDLWHDARNHYLRSFESHEIDHTIDHEEEQFIKQYN